MWSAFVPGLAEGDLYKYRVHGADGSVVMRSDPYAFSTELRPGTASRLAKLDFHFDDSAWMERRDKCRNRPLNIYEMHVGSWRHKPGSKQEDGSDGWYNYEELAKELIPWLLDHHFTHVELLPLAEHPFDGSLGLPDHRLLFRYQPLRHSRPVCRLRQRLPPDGHRRHHGLCPRPLCGQRRRTGQL